MKSRIISFCAGKSYNAAAEKERNVIGSRLAAARKRRGMTLAALCAALEEYGVKITPASANKWENGDTVPSAYQLIALFNALGIEDRLSFFMENCEPPLNSEGIRRIEEYREDLIASGRYSPRREAVKAARLIEMPVSSLAVSAGIGQFLGEDSFENLSFPEDKVPAGADFGIRVSGDSMEPVYHHGQIVWVRRCERVAAGHVGVFILDGEGYLKIFGEQTPDEGVADEFTDADGYVHPQPVLESYNPKYDPIPIRPASSFQVVGSVL